MYSMMLNRRVRLINNILVLFLTFSPLRAMAWRSHGKDNDDLVTQLKGKFIYDNMPFSVKI